ncbi:MAG: SDR family NAD(P)-dependent oxidoreductase, partial [Desulfocapsaceae bacterium]|nr:SDR family NAD(P)-dependent oxidoreductase [Desulfocapsaceae bacterium]
MKEKNNQKVAIVTGAAKGIGRAIAVELAQAGYYTVINYLSDQAGAEQTLAMVEEAGSCGEVIPFDVRDGRKAEEVIEDIAQRLGRIDVLVNNAGIIHDGLFMMMEPESWHSVIDTSLTGFYNMTRPIIEKMVRSRSGVVISLSSASALMPNRGQANYSA